MSRKPEKRALWAILLLITALATATSQWASLAGTATVRWAPADVLADPSANEAGHPSSEYSIAIDPTNPMRLVAVGIEHGHEPGFVCCSRGIWANALYASSDGGATWTRSGNPIPVGYDGNAMTCDDPTTWDPWVNFDRHGRAYLSYMSSGAGIPGLANPCSDSTFAVATSIDGGMTWSEPVLLSADPACFPDRDSMAADPNGDAVFAAWSAFCADGGPIMVSRTTDGGATWATPVKVTGEDLFPYGASVRVAGDGSVHVAYYREAPFDGCLNVVAAGTDGIYSGETVVASSRDGGATWSRQVVGPVCDLEYQSFGQPLNGAADFSFPMLGADPASGKLAMAWANRAGIDARLSVSASSDAGVTWSAPTTVADAGRGTFMPAVAVAGGVVRLAYVSMTTAGIYDVRYRESSDGLSWSDPFILSTQPSCQCWGPLTSTYLHGQGLGHYIGIDARAGRIAVAWPDERAPLAVQTLYTRVGAL